MQAGQAVPGITGSEHPQGWASWVKPGRNGNSPCCCAWGKVTRQEFWQKERELL